MDKSKTNDDVKERAYQAYKLIRDKEYTEAEKVICALPSFLSNNDFNAMLIYQDLLVAKGENSEAMLTCQQYLQDCVKNSLVCLLRMSEISRKSGRMELSLQYAEDYRSLVRFFGFSHIFDGSVYLGHALSVQDADQILYWGCKYIEYAINLTSPVVQDRFSDSLLRLTATSNAEEVELREMQKVIYRALSGLEIYRSCRDNEQFIRALNELKEITEV